MDLEKNIRIAFEVYWKNLPVTTELNTGTHSDAFITGAKSQAAKDYWYYEFKKELWKDNFQKSLFNDKSAHVMVNGTINSDEPNEEELELGDGILEQLKPIQSIVPIADIIPEQIISKQELLLMHDKAVERSITEETYKESRAWDIKKEKKVSHKRTNKRR